MSEASITGKIHLIEETKTYGQKGFRKRLVVLEDDNGRFTNYIPVEFVQDKCETVDDLNEGDEIRVRYRLSGRKWQRDANSEVKFFLSAEALGFDVLSGGSKGGSAPVQAKSGPDDWAEEGEEEEAPF